MLSSQQLGVKIHVVERTVDGLRQRVYRLDYQRQGNPVTLPAEWLQVVEEKARALPGEAVIRAAAAQLLQVLGKDCPFVGPGFWTVTRDEGPAKAWGQLCSLVGEM